MSNSDDGVIVGKGQLDERASIDSPELAQKIITILRTKNIHPVLVFGTQASGKTMMLQSLFHYAKSNDDSQIALSRGTVIWPDDADRDQIEESGRLFLDNDLVSFDARIRPDATSRRSNFFIPVDVVHKGRLTRFAFLEGMGEWFERRQDIGASTGVQSKRSAEWQADAMPFRPLREIVKQVLQTYEHGLSMIFVAPCIDGPSGTSKDYAHVCLDHVLSQVEQLRADKQRDNLLLLLNKWDAICSPAEPGGRFADASANFVLEQMRTWSFVWPKFVSLHGFPDTARAVMPYSAAWIGTDGKMLSSSRYSPVFARYNRTLWNWVYGNASVAMSSDIQAGRSVLYPDVVPGEAQKMLSYEKMLRFLTFNK